MTVLTHSLSIHMLFILSFSLCTECSVIIASIFVSLLVTFALIGLFLYWRHHRHPPSVPDALGTSMGGSPPLTSSSHTPFIIGRNGRGFARNSSASPPLYNSNANGTKQQQRQQSPSYYAKNTDYASLEENNGATHWRAQP